MLIRDYLQYPCGRYKPEENRKVITSIPIEYGRDYPRSFRHEIYNVDGSVIFIVRIPSRRKEKVTYDVAIAVMGTMPDDAKVEPRNMDFRAFSNSPSFYYRHAHTFRRLGAFIDFLGWKFDQKIWDTPPKGEAPQELGYERTVYLALYHLNKNRLLSFPYENLLRKARPISQKSLAGKIKSAEAQEVEADKSRDTKQEAARKSNIKEKKAVREAAKSGSPPAEIRMKRVGNTVKVSTAKRSASSHGIKKSKGVSKLSRGPS